MAEEPDARKMTLERDIVAWERRALKAERERDEAANQERQRIQEALERMQRFVPGMKDEGHPDGSEYPSIRPHDEGDLLRRRDVLAALDTLDPSGESDYPPSGPICKCGHRATDHRRFDCMVNGCGCERYSDPSGEDKNGFEHCHRCGRGNTVWFAPSPLWNAVMRGGSIDGEPKYDDLVCATCFMHLAEEQGVASHFKVFAEKVDVELETTTPSGRVWDDDRQLWGDPSGEEVRSDDADQAAARRSSDAPAVDGSPRPSQSGTEGGAGVGADPSPARSRTRGAELDLKEEWRPCPDEGICHHGCGVGECFRVHHCAPLSAYGEEWERETVEAFSDPSGEQGEEKREERQVDAPGTYKELLERVGIHPETEQLRRLLHVHKGVNQRLAARLEEFEDACPHRDMTLTGDGNMRCDRCGHVEPDPFYKNPHGSPATDPSKEERPNILSVDEASAVVAASFAEDHDSDVFEAAVKRLGDWVDRELGVSDAG